MYLVTVTPVRLKAEMEKIPRVQKNSRQPLITWESFLEAHLWSLDERIAWVAENTGCLAKAARDEGEDGYEEDVEGEVE